VLWTVDSAQILSFGIYGHAQHVLAALGSGQVPDGFRRPQIVSVLPAELPAAVLSPSRAATSAT
jgi:hypothetical protein